MTQPSPSEDAPPKTTEDDRRQRYERLLAGFDLLDQGVTIFDRDLKLLAWNRPFLSLLDFPEHLAFVGADFESFIRFNAERGEYGGGGSRPAIEAQVAERVAKARAFQPHVTERRRPNGSIIRARGEPLPHDGFITLYSDITEQRYIEDLVEHQKSQLEERVHRRTAQLENANANLSKISVENARIAEALRRSEERLRLINDTIPTMVGYVDKNEVYQYANKGYANWFSAPGVKVVGHRVEDVVGADLYPRIAHHVRDALAGKQVTYEYSVDRQGRTVHARSTLVPERGPDGGVLGFFVFSYDISEEKRMQAALIHAQKLEAIGQLTGGLAHDFNNLLTVVIGNLAALRERRGDDAEVADFIDPALQSARRGVELIRRLLTFARQQPLNNKPVDVGQLISSIGTLIRRSLPESIVFETELPARPLCAMADPGQLESALLNFALNARDAMPDGGRLVVRAGETQLYYKAADYDVAPGNYVMIEVEDAGQGMDAGTLARVFEPFFTTKRPGLGSGLGLAMVYDFARQSAGGIRLKSSPGVGTTVSLVLPLVSGEDADETGDEDLVAHPGELALLVEDDPAVRKIVRQQLIDLGYPVLEAEDGAQALEVIAQVPDIALMLSDIVMPGGIDGRQLARLAKAQRPSLRVLLMSGYAEPPGEPEAHGAEHVVLPKPFSRQDLARALAACERSPRP